MSYTPLKNLYYQNREEYEKAYAERFGSEYAHRLGLKLGEYEAFFVVTPEIQQKLTDIRKADKELYIVTKNLPERALEQFSLNCLVDEIVITNGIEGVQSTRKEINGVLNGLKKRDKKHRFDGLVRKYETLRRREDIPLRTPSDVRKIYDELVLPEVLEDDAENMPDGTIFRRESVSVESASQKELHRGLYPETRIIEVMERALSYLNDEREDLLLRISVFHYLFGYIHPFYDGNGRLSRFISSYMLTKELEPILAYRLSYTIRENLNKYYEAFRLCNMVQSRGDLTPFVEFFANIIEKSLLSLLDTLKNARAMLTHYTGLIPRLPSGDNTVCGRIYDALIVSEIFSGGASIPDLLTITGKGRDTVRKYLKRIADAGLLKEYEKQKNEKSYGIELSLLDAYESAEL